MSEGTMRPEADVPGQSTFDVEFTTLISTNEWRRAIRVAEFPRVSSLRKLFAKVELISINAEARQLNLLGDDNYDLQPLGHVFLAVIPTAVDSDAQTGGGQNIVLNVPNKQTFPMSSNEQGNKVFNFNLSGYEVDLAQDPRRGAGPVAWIGNSGIAAKTEKSQSVKIVPLVSVTWRIQVACSGTTPMWL